MIIGENIASAPLRWGMVGGGSTSQIGYCHRSASLRDNNFSLLAGAFDTDPVRCRDFGQKIGVDVSRCYPDYKTMFLEETSRPDGIEVVTIATPNSTHYEISKAALEAGLHVICEKPLCFWIKEAEELASLAKSKNRVFGMAYAYAGYPLIRQAAEMVQRGDLGKIRIINMQFAHGWHNIPVEKTDPGAQWRMDPNESGPSYILGDLGTHPLYLTQAIVPDLEIESLLCTTQSFVEGRRLEDNANVLIRYKGGAVGHMWCSGVNSGAAHSQIVRIIGEKASLEWWDEHPNQLKYEIQGEPSRVLERGAGYLFPSSLEEGRISAGHPEGMFESWSNLYRRYALAIHAVNKGDKEFLSGFWYPDVEAGVKGVRFVNKCIESAKAGSVWVNY